MKNKVHTVILAVIAVMCITYLAVYNSNLKKNSDVYEELRGTESVEVTEDVMQETEEAKSVSCEQLYDFEELRQKNSDIYAWITIPDMQVDYPVLQSETDNYYLEHNLDHSTGYPGCIYTNSCNEKDFSDYNTVLYGHNMKNGSMFGCLHSFEDADFFAENRYIYVYTPERKLTYEICAAVKFSDVYIPAYYNVKDSIGRDAFYSDVVSTATGSSISHVLEGVNLSEEDKLITLSTCVNGEREKRYLVIGRLVENIGYVKER